MSEDIYFSWKKILTKIGKLFSHWFEVVKHFWLNIQMIGSLHFFDFTK